MGLLDCDGVDVSLVPQSYHNPNCQSPDMAPSEKSVTSVSRGDGLTGHALRRRIDIACGMMFFL